MLFHYSSNFIIDGVASCLSLDAPWPINFSNPLNNLQANFEANEIFAPRMSWIIADSFAAFAVFLVE